MKYVILTAVLVMAMVCSALAQETTVECDVVMIGAGQDTIDIQLTAVDGSFTGVWFVLTGDKQEEQMATAYMAVALENKVSVTLVTEGVVTDLTPLKDIYMMVPQPKKSKD